MKPRDLAIYAFLSIAWGLSFLVILHSANAFGWIGATTFRCFIAAATLFLISGISRRRLDFSAGWKHFAVVGATTVAGQLLGLSYSTPIIGTAMGAICVASIPLFSMVISQLWGLERITLQGLCGLLLGIVGIIFLVGFPAHVIDASFLLGCMAALGACFAAAYGSNYASRHLSRVGSMEITIGAFVLGGLMTLPFLLLVPVPTTPQFSDFIYLFISGAVMSALTYVLYFKLVSSVGPTKAISVEFVVTIIAVVVGAIFLGEQLTMIQLVGAVIIIGGCTLVLSARSGRRRAA